MGIGMALVMSPMSTAAMNAVAAEKAGVASGILSMNRMVGGSLGVAVIGAVFPPQPRPAPDPAAFVDAFNSAMWVATGVAALGAVLAIALAARQGPARAEALAESEASGAHGARREARRRAAPRSRRLGCRRPSAPASAGLGEVDLGQRLDRDLAEARDRLAVGAPRSRDGAAGHGREHDGGHVEPRRADGFDASAACG